MPAAGVATGVCRMSRSTGTRRFQLNVPNVGFRLAVSVAATLEANTFSAVANDEPFVSFDAGDGMLRERANNHQFI